MTTPTKEELTELLERVRKAERPDRQLDYAVSRMAGDEDMVSSNPEGDKFIMAGSRLDEHIPIYTASIDAAVGLVERMLPEANYYGVERSPDGWEAHVSRNYVVVGHWFHHAEGLVSGPLAILAALLQALIAQQEQSS